MSLLRKLRVWLAAVLTDGKHDYPTFSDLVLRSST